MTREEYAKLTPEEKRIKVAELCGWEHIYEVWYWENDNTNKRYKRTVLVGYLNSKRKVLPDSPRDLNAMHEAIMGVPREGNFVIEFERNLIRVLKDDEEQPANPFLWMAKSGQLCEAFVLTMTQE